jgi:hypothetical protein
MDGAPRLLYLLCASIEFSLVVSYFLCAQTIRHHISSSSLFAHLGIEPLEAYYHRRLLRWAGHINITHSARPITEIASSGVGGDPTPPW